MQLRVGTSSLLVGQRSEMELCVVEERYRMPCKRRAVVCRCRAWVPALVNSSGGGERGSRRRRGPAQEETDATVAEFLAEFPLHQNARMV